MGSILVWLTILQAQTAPSSVAATGVPSAVITGRVIDGATRAPIAGAVVALRPSGSNSGRTGVPGPGSQVTDQYGRFVLAGVPAGRFDVLAQKAGYFDGAFGTESTGGVPRRVAIEDGQWRRDLQIELWKPAAISGTVIDEAGEPVVGAQVAVLARIFVSGEPSYASGPVTRTDDRGMYRIAPLTAGAYAVVVPTVQVALSSDAASSLRSRFPHALPVGGDQVLMFGDGAILPPQEPGARPRAYPTVFHPGVRSLTAAAVVELVTGESRAGIDVQLQPAPVSRVHGRVDGPDNAAVQRRLRLMAAGTEHLGIGHEIAIAAAREDGTFAFVNVPDGQYTILADGGAGSYDLEVPGADFTPWVGAAREVAAFLGFRSASMPLATAAAVPWRSAPGPSALLRVSSVSLDESDGYTGRTSVAVAGADVPDVVVRLQQASLRGRFVIDTPADREALVAITPYLELAAEPAGFEAPGRQIRGGVVPSDPDLEFTMTGVVPGSYALRFAGLAAMTKSVTWNGRDFTGVPLPLEGGDAAGLTVTLTTRIASMEGLVRDRQGRQVGQGAVIVFPVNAAQWRWYGPQPDRLTSVNVRDDGTFRVHRLPAGEYHVVAVEEGLARAWRDPAFLEAAARISTRVSLAWGENHVQDLTLQGITR